MRSRFGTPGQITVSRFWKWLRQVGFYFSPREVYVKIGNRLLATLSTSGEEKWKTRIAVANRRPG